MRSRLLLSSLVLVLTAVSLPAASAAGARPRPSGSFSVLAYNVAGLTEGISKSNPSKNSPLISERLNAYDLVLLQEDWEDPLHTDTSPGATSALPAAYYHHLIVSKSAHLYRSKPATNPVLDPSRAPKGPATVADGLNRLSSMPFGEMVGNAGKVSLRQVTRVMWTDCFGEVALVPAETVVELGADELLVAAGLGAVNDATKGGSGDCGAQKGFSVASTEIADGVEVDVYNVHADAGGDHRDVEARRKNFEQLATYILEHSAGRAVVLGGDTNLKAGAENKARADADALVWSTFQSRTGLTDVCAALDCGADALVHDKVAFRNSRAIVLEPRTHEFPRARFIVDGKRLSDHDPVAVTFEWRVRPGQLRR